jgi:hypothetical protein
MGAFCRSLSVMQSGQSIVWPWRPPERLFEAGAPQTSQAMGTWL